MNEANKMTTNEPQTLFSDKPTPLPVGARLEGLARTQLLELSAAQAKPHNQLVRELLTEVLTRPIDWLQIREDLVQMKQVINQLQPAHPGAGLEKRVDDLAAELTRDQSAVRAAMRQLYQSMVGLEEHLNIEVKQTHQAATALKAEAQQVFDAFTERMEAQRSKLMPELASVRNEVATLKGAVTANHSLQMKRSNWMWACIGTVSIAVLVLFGFSWGIHQATTAKVTDAMSHAQSAEAALHQTLEQLHSESDQAKALSNQVRILQFVLDSETDRNSQ